MMETKPNHRGFELGEFVDEYGIKCSIQKSSLATDDCIWLGVDDPQPQQGPPWKPYRLPANVVMHTRMHLTRDQVAALLPLLHRFVQTGELYERADEVNNGD